VVICLERGADLHMAQLMPLPLTVSCFSKIQIGFTFLVPALPGSPGQRAVKRVYVCNYSPFIYSHNVTKPANLVRIGKVDPKIIGLTESLKIKKYVYETNAV